MNKELDDIYEAQELWEEIQQKLDPDEREDIWGWAGYPRRGNPDDKEELCHQ